MRICFVSAHSFERPGGVRTHILSLSQELEKMGHSTHILAPNVRRKETEFNTNIKNLTQVGVNIKLPITGTYAELSLFTKTVLEQFFAENEFDLIHFHNYGPFISSDATYYAPENIAKIMTFHVFPTGMSKALYSPQNVSDLSKIFDHSIFVSESQSEMYSLLDKNKFSIIPNGIKINKNAKPKILNKNEKISILYVGRIEQRKGLHYLLEAYKKLEEINQNLELHIVGSGPMDFVDKFIKSTSVKDTITFHGSISDEKLMELRKEMTIFVSPAYKGESFGIVLLEAMTEGLPTVGFDNPGYRTVMQGELSKLLAKNCDVDDLVKRILFLIENPKNYAKYSKLGIELSEQYDWTKVASKIESLYRKFK